MSVAATNRVWRHSAKGGARLLLLLAMADWADDWGYCYPSLEQMAGKCRQTERNILNLIADLEQAAELRRVARGKGGRGRSYTSVYQVITGLSPAEMTASEQSSPWHAPRWRGWKAEKCMRRPFEDPRQKRVKSFRAKTFPVKKRSRRLHPFCLAH